MSIDRNLHGDAAPEDSFLAATLLGVLLAHTITLKLTLAADVHKRVEHIGELNVS